MARGGRFGKPNTVAVSGAVAHRKKKELESATTNAVADPEKNWADKPDSAAYEAAEKLYPLIVKAFENKDEQIQAIEEYWNIYQATPDDNQQYAGNSSGYIPAVRDALNARAKRVLKQLFPTNNKHVEGISSDGKSPDMQLSLLEHYIRKTGLKSIVRSDLLAGDVTGQWNLMLDWTKSTRTITKLVKRNPIITHLDGEKVDDLELEDPSQEEEATEDEEIIEEGPEIVDFATDDLAVIPPTCNDLQKAKAAVVRLRLSKEAVQGMVDEGVFILPDGMEIDDLVQPDGSRDKKNPAKRQTKDAGVKTQGIDKYALIFCAYTKLDLGGERKDEAIVYYASKEEILGIIKNPLWSGKRPILSKPVERVQGSVLWKIQGRAGEVPAMEPDRLLEHGPGLGDVLAAAGIRGESAEQPELGGHGGRIVGGAADRARRYQADHVPAVVEGLGADLRPHEAADLGVAGRE